MNIFKKMISIKSGFLFVVLFTTIVFYSFAQELDDGKIPMYAEPVYNYKPLKIKVGKYSNQLKTNDASQLLVVVDSIKSNIDDVNIETLYVLSLRLYDLGKKDEAFYWFQTAKSRARLFIDMLDPKEVGGIGSDAFEYKQLFLAFNQIAGIYLNAYGFNDVEKGADVMELVKNEMKAVRPYKTVYKKVEFLPDSELEGFITKREKEWVEGVDYFRTNKDEIKKKRIEAGIQDKY